MNAAELDAVELLVEAANLAVGAAHEDIDAARDVFGRTAKIVLLSSESRLENIEVVAQALEREQRLVDLCDLRGHATAEPFAGQSPAGEVAVAVGALVAELRREVAAVSCTRDAIEEELALAPRVRGELHACVRALLACGARRDERGMKEALAAGAVT